MPLFDPRLDQIQGGPIHADHQDPLAIRRHLISPSRRGEVCLSSASMTPPAASHVGIFSVSKPLSAAGAGPRPAAPMASASAAAFCGGTTVTRAPAEIRVSSLN